MIINVNVLPACWVVIVIAPQIVAVVVLNSHFHGQLLNAVFKLTATYLRYHLEGVPKRQTVGNAKLCLLPKKPFIHSESQSVSYLVRKANKKFKTVVWKRIHDFDKSGKISFLLFFFFGCTTKTALKVNPPIVKDL